MKQRHYFLPTLKEEPAEAEVISHKLMVRSGMIRKLTAGIYNYLPLGLRVKQKLEKIVREEMNRAGAQELYMSMVQPSELWKESRRWEVYGKELMRLKDRHNREFCLGPTHEEVITEIVRKEIRSYRDLPFTLYQIQNKFRDEIRPRFGIMRCREFTMKDAYSFDATDEGATESYQKMSDAYHRIFSRCGLEFRAVEADSGNIGGSISQEFMVLADTGESELASCTKCNYSANTEKATDTFEKISAPKSNLKLEKVNTPNKKSVEEVAAFLKVQPTSIIKTLIFNTAEGPVAALVRGDYDINEIKLKNILDTDWAWLATDEEVMEFTNSPVGFAGPVGLKMKILADESLEGASSMVAGANEKDTHFLNVDIKRDIEKVSFADIRTVRKGSLCPKCQGELQFSRGIEVGHIFKLGTKYSEAMNATFTDEQGKEHPIIMGCYGIGIGRTIAAAVEQNHDKDGIIFPVPLAPFDVSILPLDLQDERIVKASEKLYQELQQDGLEVLLDDREERPGRKFKDADLIGIPIQVVLGSKNIDQEKGEFKIRKQGKKELLPIQKIASQIKDYLAHEKES
jgi:prolyl-tRNA synthetase